MNFDEFDKIEIQVINNENSFDKIQVKPESLTTLLSCLKNNPKFSFDRLNCIVAVDNKDHFEIIYDLCSLKRALSIRVSAIIDRETPVCPSVIHIFKSAYFDECEIFDLFGIEFSNNTKLKRLLMPKGWIGHPLRKDYKQSDERLTWSKK